MKSSSCESFASSARTLRRPRRSAAVTGPIGRSLDFCLLTCFPGKTLAVRTGTPAMAVAAWRRPRDLAADRIGFGGEPAPERPVSLNASSPSIPNRCLKGGRAAKSPGPWTRLRASASGTNHPEDRLDAGARDVIGACTALSIGPRIAGRPWTPASFAPP